MDGRSSKLAEKIYSKYKKRIINRMKKGSLVGMKFKINNKFYTITDGEFTFNIDKFKKDILKKIKHESDN